MRIRLIHQISVIIFLTVTVGAFNNCSSQHDAAVKNDLLSLGNSTDSINLFKNTLHPVLVQNCGQCHGVSQSPPFALSDAASAHRNVISAGLVNFTSPQSSRLVQKILIGHQGKSPAVATQIQTQIGSWGSQLQAIGGALPSPEPLVATYSSISERVLVPKCVGCHGPVNPDAGERYDTYTETIKSINKVTPIESKLYKITKSGEMPPAPAEVLTSEELAVILAWITAGAQNN